MNVGHFSARTGITRWDPSGYRGEYRWGSVVGLSPRLVASVSRGALPHHNEIAVDDQNISADHKLYRATANGPGDRQAFANQFRWRKNTAIQHIQKALLDNYQL